MNPGRPVPGTTGAGSGLPRADPSGPTRAIVPSAPYPPPASRVASLAYLPAG